MAIKMVTNSSQCLFDIVGKRQSRWRSYWLVRVKYSMRYNFLLSVTLESHTFRLFLNFGKHYRWTETLQWQPRWWITYFGRVKICNHMVRKLRKWLKQGTNLLGHVKGTWISTTSINAIGSFTIRPKFLHTSGIYYDHVKDRSNRKESCFWHLACIHRKQWRRSMCALLHQRTTKTVFSSA